MFLASAAECLSFLGVEETPTSALDRLRRFRAAYNDRDEVDQESGLTADDLDAILSAAPTPTDLEPGGTLTIDDLGNMA